MKNIGVLVSVAIFLIGIIVGAGKLIAETTDTKAKVAKLEDKIEVVKEKTDKNETRQESIKEKVEGIDNKLDKVLDLLIRKESK